MPAFLSTLSCHLEDGFNLNGDINEFAESLNELTESFLQFIQGNYMQASEILASLIDQQETNCIENPPILARLYLLRSECHSRSGRLKSKFISTDFKDVIFIENLDAYEDGIQSEKVEETLTKTNLERQSSAVSVGKLDNGDTEFIIDRKKWNIMSSFCARHTINPIRQIVDRCKLLPNPDKTMISLSIGDPTSYGNMLPPAEASQAINEAFAKPTSHGYVSSCGTEEAREAVAKLWSRDGFVLNSKDIILTSGCSHALEMCINVMADAGDNILIPQPGFSLYVTLCQSLNIEPRFYKLKAENNWEVDLDDMIAAIDGKTKAVLVNNPSNPCGAVYSSEHLQKIIRVCEKYHLPIIADEIYADMVFPGNKFHFLGLMSSNVPVLSCGGLAKRYICPGWRVGWIVIYNHNNAFDEYIRPGLLDLSSRILGPNSVAQVALPQILSNTPQKYFEDIINQIQMNATVCCEMLGTAPGLKPIPPQGTMYMLIGLDGSAYDDIEDDTVFFTKLFNEQSVSCLPASVFGASNYIRVILTAPLEKTREACQRIVEFCLDHQKLPNIHTLARTISVKRTVGDEGLPTKEESILPYHTKSKKYG